MSEPIQLITSKTDQEKATQYRTDLLNAMKPVLEILTNATRDGLVINVSFGPNAFKEIVLTGLIIAKHFD